MTETISSSTSMYCLSSFTEHPCNGTDRYTLLGWPPVINIKICLKYCYGLHNITYLKKNNQLIKSNLTWSIIIRYQHNIDFLITGIFGILNQWSFISWLEHISNLPIRNIRTFKVSILRGN